jgi:hypothetical protein
MTRNFSPKNTARNQCCQSQQQPAERGGLTASPETELPIMILENVPNLGRPKRHLYADSR